jgi:HEAT repeat protein
MQVRQLSFSREGRLLFLVFAGWLAWTAIPAARGDSVDDLRETLRTTVLDVEARDRQVRQDIGKLTAIGDLRRALLLREWRDLEGDEKIGVVDIGCRNAVCVKFKQIVHEVLKNGDTPAKLAVMTMLCEMAPTVRGPGSKVGFVRVFASDVASCMQQSDPSVREAAAHTLSQISPDPKIAVPALSHLLESKELSQRLAAIEGLVALVQVASQLTLHNQNPNGVELSRTDLVDVSCACVRLAAQGMRDVQPEIRRRSIEAVGQAADALRGLVGSPRAVDEMENWNGYQRRVDLERSELLPLIQALREHGPALTRALGDPDGEVRLLARRALEDMTSPQVRLLQRATVASDNSPSPPFILSSSKKDPLAENLRGTVKALADGMSDPDPRARRAAIDVLESLGTSAEPAAAALVTALADPDQFVRWSAARTLGKIAPVEVETAVPGLAGLLTDPDLDLRLAAATALEHYGAAAKGSVPDLIKACGEGDPEFRAAAIHALGAVGPQESATIVPALIPAFENPDARVRTVAIQVAGGFGPQAKACLDPLRKALRDSNPDVQKAASEALLNILTKQ